jgi:hypothetical protein
MIINEKIIVVLVEWLYGAFGTTPMSLMRGPHMDLESVK